MEKHVLRVVSLIIVAVHTMVVVAFVGTVVFINHAFRKVFEIALVKAELAIKFVARFDEAIGKIRVNRFFCHADAVFGKLHPVRAALGIDRNGEFLALGFGEQLPPLRRVERQFAVGGCAGGNGALAVGDGGNIFVALRFYHKVERRDVGRDYDVAVIGIDVGRFIHGRAFCGYLGLPCARGEQAGGKQEERYIDFHKYFILSRRVNK